MKWGSSNVEGRGAVASKWGRATSDRRASLATAPCALITIGPTNHIFRSHHIDISESYYSDKEDAVENLCCTIKKTKYRP
ncbi:hypothetical protein Tco_1441159, partial [Tanacetum coccineum]